jgi:hypothetical protein
VNAGSFAPSENGVELTARFASWARESASLGDPALSRRVQAMMLDLARLAQSHIPPTLWASLDQAERYLAGQATESELFDALQDTWGYVTGLACGVGPAEGRAAQIVMACLEGKTADQAEAQLMEQVRRVLAAGVPVQAAAQLLDK